MLVLSITVGVVFILENISSGYAGELGEKLVPLSPLKVRQIDSKNETSPKNVRSDSVTFIHKVISTDQSNGTLSSKGSWKIIPEHDFAGGIFRVSGDGPKPTDIADPIVDLGYDYPDIGEMILEHPNFIYLPHLSECGFSALDDNEGESESGSEEKEEEVEGGEWDKDDDEEEDEQTDDEGEKSHESKSEESEPKIAPGHEKTSKNGKSKTKKIKPVPENGMAGGPTPLKEEKDTAMPQTEGDKPTPKKLIFKFPSSKKSNDTEETSTVEPVGAAEEDEEESQIVRDFEKMLEDKDAINDKRQAASKQKKPKPRPEKSKKPPGKGKNRKGGKRLKKNRSSKKNSKQRKGSDKNKGSNKQKKGRGAPRMTTDELKKYIEKNYIGTVFSDDDVSTLSEFANARNVDTLIKKLMTRNFKNSQTPYLAVIATNQNLADDLAKQTLQNSNQKLTVQGPASVVPNPAKINVQTDRIKRIVGGNIVRHQKHPWMVQLYLYNVTSGEHQFHCAGTLITTSTILTAAHCMTRFGPGMTLDVAVIGITDRRDIVFCNTTNVKENCSRSQIHYIEDFEVHDAYSEGNLNHDIALIYLKKPIIANDDARPICLPITKKLFEGWTDVKLTGVGWGATNKFANTGAYLSEVLKEVQFDLQPRALCDKFHMRVYGRVSGDRICTGGNTGRASCNGDSGGAVVKALKSEDEKLGMVSRVFQLGIVSAGGHPVDTCGFQGRPSIDTNVFYFLDWILNHIKPGLQAYRYETKGSGSNSTWVLNNSSVPGGDDSNQTPQSDYANEFSTGKNVDVSKHPNINLLPSFDVCGNLPKSTADKKQSETSEESEDEESINDAHVDIVGTAKKDGLRRKRIVGGVPTTAESFYPWMAQIFARNVETDEASLRCSGTIISKNHILTAAHCVTEVAPPYVFDSIIVGQYNRNKTQECFGDKCYSPIKVKISHIMIHNDYEKYTHKNNIALIKLSQDLQFTKMVHPICLPHREGLIEGIRMNRYFTVGWGQVQREGQHEDDLSRLLLQMYVDTQPREDCNFVYSRTIDELDRSRVCAGGRAGQGECMGDGGSPLMKRFEMPEAHPINGKIFGLGIVSFADCGMQGMPTVYTNVLYYMDWILDNLDEDS